MIPSFLGLLLFVLQATEKVRMIRRTIGFARSYVFMFEQVMM